MKQLHDVPNATQIELDAVRLAQGELLASRDRYEHLYDYAPVAYLTLTRDSLITEINLTGARLLGIAREQLLNSRFRQFIACEDSARWDGYFQQALQAKCRGGCEIKCLRGDGSSFHARMDCLYLEGMNEENAVRITLTDISERNLIEARLRESEAKFRAIFAGTLDGIVLVDDEGLIVDCNPEFIRQTSLSLPQLRQTRIWELRPADKVVAALLRFQKILASGIGDEVDLKFRQANGQVIQVEFRSTVVSIGERRYLQCISRDITERKRTEAELAEYQQLLRELSAQGVAAREAELKHLAREVHDELGQTLTALRMDISLLRIQFGEHDPALMAKIQDMLKLVGKAIQGVRDVTINLRPPALDMGIVPAISWLCNTLPDHSDTVCSLNVIDEPTGLSDNQTTTLFRIVQESLTNVARHSAASRVAITVKNCNENIAIEIKDNGIGFEAADYAGKKTFGLLGMQERALALGGKVDVFSAPEKGTAVLVHIPLHQTHPGRRSDDLPVNSRRSCDCARGLKENICADDGHQRRS